MKLIDADSLIEHAEVNCESSDFVERLIDYVAEQEEVFISCSHEKDLISRRAAIDALEEHLDYLQMLNKDENPTAESNWYGVNWARNTIAELPSAQPELTENWWKTDHGYMWLCPHCGLPVHSDFEECLRCGIKRPSAQHERKKGKCIDGFCSECHHEAITEWNDRGGEYALTRYCPYCGAKMEE